MATEYPPLSKIHVVGYSANDKDYPILNQLLDPRVAGYKVPEDFSICPDKRYPNHIFTGAQPISGDQRVRHTWEILPSPWIPFTRYDDDLGPIQGRRRSVKNEGQQASLTSSTKISYEGREGSSIVLIESEETWSIKVDEDGNSLFPTKIRDFYDPSRGAIEERRQLFVPTGDEVASLQNENGIITQTSYEPYNEYLSYKIVQTYSVSGPRLVGYATDNDGQLVKITTERKAADSYYPPNPTALKTVETSAEDKESVIERVTEKEEIFSAKLFGKEADDPTPAKFKLKSPTIIKEETVSGNAGEPFLDTEKGEVSKSEQQVNKFTKRLRSTLRSILNLPQTLIQKATNNEGQIVTVTETLQVGDTNEFPNAKTTIESEALGDGRYIVRKTIVPEVFDEKTISIEIPDVVPQKFRADFQAVTNQKIIEGKVESPVILDGDLSKSEQQITNFVKRISSTSRNTSQLPIILQQKSTNQEKQNVNITETLQIGNTDEEQSATVTIESESLGGNKYIVRKTEVPEVFDSVVYRKTREDNTPQKFKAAQTSITTEKNEEGQASNDIKLDKNEFDKSEQQINKFVKRISTTSRGNKEGSQSIIEQVLTQYGQVGEKTITLSDAEQTINPNALFVDGGVEALGDGRTVKTEVKVDEVFAEKVISAERPDQIPTKFKVNNPLKTTEETIEGDVEEPVLTKGVISKSEIQKTKFTKRVATSSRDVAQLPIQLTQKTTDNDGLFSTVIETLQSGDTTEKPSATQTIESEAVGDGTYIVKRVIKPELFASELFSTESVDLIPEKFKSEIPTIVNERTVEGKAEQPVLNIQKGEVSKSEQQVNKFTKRTRTVSRDATKPKTFTQKTTTNDGLLATVTETLQDGDTNESPSATQTIESEALGDGRYIIKKTVTPEVFPAKTLSVEAPDIIPLKFRADYPSKTTQENVEGKIEDPVLDLSKGDISKSEQQISNFIKRKSAVTREAERLPIELLSVDTNQEKQKVIIKEKLQKNPDADDATATVDVKKEAIGGDMYIVTTSTIPEVFKSAIKKTEKVDLTPEKFKALQPITIKEQNEEGSLDENDLILQPNEISKSEQQINKFVKRTSTETRDTSKGGVLTEQVITPDGQLGTRTITLSAGLQNLIPSPNLISGEVENLGDDRSVKTEVTVGEVFNEKLESSEKPEIIPAEFRATNLDKTTSEVTAGKDTGVSLDPEEKSKTRQRISENKVRETKVVRPEKYDELTGEFIDSDGIKVTRTKTLQKAKQFVTPNATTTGSVDAIGDQYTIKTEDIKQKLFDGKVVSASKEEIIPIKFRSNEPTDTKVVIKEQNSVDDKLTLNTSEREKTQQRLTEFLVKETIVSRADKEEYDAITSSNLDETWNIQIPFEESIESEINENEKLTEYDGIGLNKYIKRTYKSEELENSFSDYKITIPTKISLDLPRTLKKIDVSFEERTSSSYKDLTSDISGVFDSISLQDTGYVSSTLSIIPKFEITMKENWARDIDAEVHIFFIKKDNLNPDEIRGKVGAISDWPKFSPEGFSQTVYGYSETKTLSLTYNRSVSTSGGEDYGTQQSIEKSENTEQSSYAVSLDIPPCIRADFVLTLARVLKAETKKINIKLPAISTSQNGQVLPAISREDQLDHQIQLFDALNIPKTEDTIEIPKVGKYVVNTSVEPYKFDWFLVRATVVDAAKI